MQKLVVVVYAAVLAGLVEVGDCGLGFGTCPNQELIKQFNQLSYIGTWYEFGRYASVEQIFESCVTDTLGRGANNIITVVTTYKSFGRTRAQVGQLKPAVPGSRNSNYSITYDENGFDGRENEETVANYKILATDYSNYAIVWSCSNALFLNFQGVRVLTRDREPDEGLIEDIRAEMTQRDLSWFFFTRTNQNCD